MKKLNLIIGIAVLGGLASCKTTNTNITSIDNRAAVSYLFSTEVNGGRVGSATFYHAGKDGIRMDLRINDARFAGKNVAVHFHDGKDCGGKGENTHGHWNPTNENHGRWGAAPHHSGDIGNIMLDATGAGEISITTNRWSIDSASDNTIIGRSIIVHDGTDDYTTQPTGNSGARVGCGQIMTP